MDDLRHDDPAAHDPAHDMTRDPVRDPVLGALLREVEGGWREGAPAALEARVLAAAAPALAGLRRQPQRERERPGWWEWAAGWSPVAVSAGLLAAAAALALALRLPAASTGTGGTGLGGALVDRSLSEHAVLTALAVPHAEAVDTIVGPATGDWLLAATVQMQMETPPYDDADTDTGGADRAPMESR